MRSTGLVLSLPVTQPVNSRTDFDLERSTELDLSLPVTQPIKSLTDIGPGRDTELVLIPPATPGLQGRRNPDISNRLYTTFIESEAFAEAESYGQRRGVQ